MRSRKVVAVLMTSLLVLAGMGPARAQDAWPSKPLRLIVAAAAGSGTDVLARLLVDRLSPVLKQPILIDNRPGANGIVATTALLQAPADGYTLIYHPSSFVVIAPTLVQLPYDTVKDLEPIAQAASGSMMLVVGAQTPVRNVKELVAYVKDRPGKLSFGSVGNGSMPFLLTETMQQNTPMEVNHVPYKASPQMLTDIIGGNLLFGWSDPTVVLPLIQANRLRGIAISGASRLAASPDIPTLKEQGYPIALEGWFGIFAKAGTPQPIIKRLSDDIRRIQETPEMAAELARRNLSMAPAKTPAEFHVLIEANLKMWAEVVRKGNVKAD